MYTINQSKKITVHNLTIFAAVVLAIGWIGHGLDMLLGNPSSDSLGMLLWIVTPLGVSLILRAFAGDGWKDFGIKLNFKGNLIWYVIALLVYPVVTTLVLITGIVSDSLIFPNFSLSTPGMFLQVFAMALLPGFFKNIFEEFAWRGYLTPKVHSLHINDFAGHLIVGLIWSLWHLPYFIFFLDRVVLQKYTTLKPIIFIPMAIVAMLSWAIVYGEIRLLTNSVWPVVLMHMIEDAFITPLLLEGYIRIAPGMNWLFSPVVGILSIVLFIAIGVVLRKLRKKQKKLG